VGTVRLFIADGMEGDYEAEAGTTALHVAAKSNHANIVSILLMQPGIDANALDRDSSTALHAAWKCSRESLRLLLGDPRIDN
jgi:ankyrin repeat protein